MYDSYMSMKTYPLGLPDELMADVKKTAKDTHLSMADAMRQAIRFGLPQLRKALSTEADMPAAPTVRFVKRGRYTVGHTDKHVSLETIKELLAEFP